MVPRTCMFAAGLLASAFAWICAPLSPALLSSDDYSDRLTPDVALESGDRPLDSQWLAHRGSGRRDSTGCTDTVSCAS